MNDDRFTQIKAKLRLTAKSQRVRLSAADRVAAAASAAEHFLAGVPHARTDMIAAYWPIRDEIDIKPLLLALMDAGKGVALPVIMGDSEPLKFRVWEQDAPLYEAGFGTLAPGVMTPEAEPDIMIIPLLGFDKSGTRLGYGRGYYDRTIDAAVKKPLLVGYAFAAQELPEIPRAEHDVPLDMIVTEAGVRRFDN